MPSPIKVVALGAGLILLGAWGFHELPGMIATEGDISQNKWIDAFYCSIITLTTVGYGDICPADLTGHDSSKLFLVVFAFLGLGFFCGPVMDFAAQWANEVPGGNATSLITAIALGIGLFSHFEGWDAKDSAYYSVITGTTIGYGDMYPKTDNGKIAAAFFAIVAVNVVGALLGPAQDILNTMVSEDDKDGDGMIDKNELKALKTDLDNAFKALDALNDVPGKVEAAEFIEIRKAINAMQERADKGK